jgi:hypothetical protein
MTLAHAHIQRKPFRATLIVAFVDVLPCLVEKLHDQVHASASIISVIYEL